MALNECLCRPGESGDIVLEFAINFIAAFKKINGTVLAIFVGASRGAGQILCNRCFHRPHERMNRTKNKDGSLLIPAGFPQHLARVFGRMRLEGPTVFFPPAASPMNS